MSWYQKIVLNTFFQLAGRSVATLANFIIILLIGKTLGSFGLGQYNKVFTFIGIFALFIDFGINAVFLKVGQDQDVVRLIGLRLLIALLIFLIIQPLLILLPYDTVLHIGFSAQEKVLIELVASVLFVYAFIHSFNALFQKWQRFDLGIWTNGAYAVIALPLALYGMMNKSLAFFFFGTVAGLAGSALVAFFLVRKRVKISVRTGQKSLIWPLFLKSLPLGCTLFINILYVRADVLILSLLRSTSEVGVYTLAYKFFEFPLNLSFFAMNALYPLFIQKHRQDRSGFVQDVKKSGRLLLIFALLLTLAALILAPLIGWIQPDFRQSIPAFRILALSYPVFFLSNLLLWVIITKNQEKRLPLVYLGSLVINVFLNLLFIPPFGLMASAVITVVSELMILLLFLRMVFLIDKS